MLSSLSDLLGPDLSVSNVQYCNNNALQYQYRYQYQFSTLTVFIGAKTPNQPSNHCRVLLCQCLYIHIHLVATVTHVLAFFVSFLVIFFALFWRFLYLPSHYFIAMGLAAIHLLPVAFTAMVGLVPLTILLKVGSV